MRLASFIIISLSLYSLGSSKTIYVPDEYNDIQWAINFCQNGDTIIVRPGTYMEHIDFLGKDLTLKSEKGSKYTVIDASNYYLKSAVSFRNGEGPGSIIEGFTLTNGTGNGGYGGGVYCLNASPMILNNIIEGNTGEGGGICCDNASPEIISNVIANNTSFSNGGGICCTGNSPSPNILNNIIVGNKGVESG